MKTLTNDEIAKITKIVGEDPSTTAQVPPVGTPLTVKNISVQEGIPLRDENGVENGKFSNPWVRVDFNEGGMLSLAGILRSPDIKWNGLDKNADRIQALCSLKADDKFMFTHQEPKTSRLGQPYKVNHFVPVSIGAAPKK